MIQFSKIVLPVFVAAGLSLFATSASANDPDPMEVSPATRASNGIIAFTRMSPDSSDPNGNSVNQNCLDDFPDARAFLRIRDRVDSSRVRIWIRDAQPHTLYTFWLRLRGSTADGVSFGGSPLTNGGSTPLAPSTALDSLLLSTGSTDGVTNGSPSVANGVRTDENGDANLLVSLDFPIENGAYPFQNMETFDPDDPRLSIENPALFPVAIVDPGDDRISGSFLIRMVSHCTDGLGHGLSPAAREPWFQHP